MFKNYTRAYLHEMVGIATSLVNNQHAVDQIDAMCQVVADCKTAEGRVFFVGVGGGAGTGSHATNDFNKIAGVSALCLSDNPSLLTALWNDEGPESIFIQQMKMHRFGPTDVLFVFSVNGGKPDISSSLVTATDYAHQVGGKVIAVLGRQDGHVGQNADAACIVPMMHGSRVTPHSESWQLAINHLIVNAIATGGVFEAGG